MSQITDFYEGLGKDQKGRTLSQMQDQTDTQIEASHDFIQWMLPLHEKSFHAKYSPVLTHEDVAELRKSKIAIHNMQKTLKRFCEFLGFLPSKNEKRIRNWCHDGNHNLLRVTRAIRSLRLFGLETEARIFYELAVEAGNLCNIGNMPFHFWKKALTDDVWESLTDDFLKLKRIELK